MLYLSDIKPTHIREEKRYNLKSIDEDNRLFLLNFLDFGYFPLIVEIYEKIVIAASTFSIKKINSLSNRLNNKQ